MESTESRFAHLLQPIRELTKNWEIDVASELNDYLEELEEMCITFDGEKTQLNFAEAALLIQGSACIYSKKVELLHNLVYQTLESINEKKKKRNNQGADSQDGVTNSGEEIDDADEFEPVDVEESQMSATSDLKKHESVDVIPLPPQSLVPLEALEKQKFPLISLKGEVLCSLKDFKMNLFIPGDDGMVLLHQGPRSKFINVDLSQTFYQLQENGRNLLASPSAGTSFGAAHTDDDDDRHEEFVPLEDHNMEVEQNIEEHVERHQGPSEGRVLRERRVETDKPVNEEEAPPAVNVWTFHDPYVVYGEEKPFQSGKCYKVPDGLDDGGKRKRKRAPALQDFRSWFRGTFDPPEHKLRHGPKFIDLNYVYLSTIKEKLKSRSRINKRAGVVISEEELKKTFLEKEVPEQQGEEPVDEFRHDLLEGEDDGLSENEQEACDVDDFPAEFGGGGGGDLISPDLGDVLTYEDLVKLHVEQLVQNSQGYIQETALSRRVKDWEDKIRPELELQEERPMFDIHDYGDRIVRSLGSVGNHQRFSSIVQGLDNFEACKYLLASLQLANDYTVEVDSVKGLEESLDTMGLTLLSLNRATERFKQDEFIVGET
ncbi:condensin-2 complex subunit H2 [Cynoglossus semilaevis]|uniref:condensin-2 complex subunit H2 n=1 Tax=Cynoglossus semilaevis TaxID=244447 RepID=UPI000495A5FD|nr:condensin-2 complex subunit H2 [Cynoglossus semilaevis]